MKVCFIFRKQADTPSIERVFDTLGRELTSRGIEVVTSTLPFGNRALGILLNLLFYRTPNADLLHITGQVHYIALRLPASKTLLTVHDVGILRNRKGFRMKAIKKVFFDWPFRKLRLITAISEATRLELIEKIGCAPERLIVVEDPITVSTRGYRPFNGKTLRILQVGTAANKNLKRLLAAVKDLPCHLTIVGKLDPEVREELCASNISFENVEAAHNDEMNDIYGRADLLTFCSIFEGFGLPIIEAQANGIPVLTSNIPPMTEVAGNGAVFVDPFNIEDIRAGIRSVIEDPALRDRVVAAGYENVQRFAPDKVANKYLAVYDMLLSGPSNSSKTLGVEGPTLKETL
jgi:glycosyltransferase involved in cell wall biosynthesis